MIFVALYVYMNTKQLISTEESWGLMFLAAIEVGTELIIIASKL